MKQWLLLSCIFAYWAANASDAPFAIIENGVSKGKIVIPAKARNVEEKAAAELKEYLVKSTGVTLPIVRENAVKAPVKGFYLGRTQAALQTGLDMEKEAPDAFLIRYSDGKLFIIGHDGSGKEGNIATAAGTLFGVYRYLIHNVGVRWLWPGDSGEFVPKKKVLHLDASADYVLHKPLQRRLCHSIWKPGLPESRWARRVFFQSSQQTIAIQWGGGHIFDKYVRVYSKTHPEWYAMRPDGTRKTTAPTSFCLSNPAFQQELLRLWKKDLAELKKKDPNAHLLLNLHRGDVELNCECAACQALDGPDYRLPTRRYSPFRNVGERYAKVALALNRKIQKIDPGSGVSLLAYQSGVYAPRQVKLDPNILAKLVVDIPFPRRAGHTKRIREEYLAWHDSGAKLFWRPNYFCTGYCMPEIWYDDFAAELNFLRDKCGIIAFDVDGPTQMWSINGVNIYVASRMSAEPGLTADAAFREYCEGFGPAADAIAKYLNYWRNYVKHNAEKLNTIHEKYCAMGWDFFGFEYPKYVFRSYPPSELRKSFPILDAAAKAAKDDPVASVKVAFLRKGLEHAIMTAETAAVFADPRSSSAARRAALTKLQTFRKSLPQYAIHVPTLNQNERRIWKIATGIPKDAILLPEYWKGCPDPENQGEKLGFQNEDFDCAKWKNVSVWNALRSQNYHDYKYMWYRVKITLPPEDSAERAYLCLGAVDEDCKIWINGKVAGGFLSNFKVDPDSWKKPFKIEITDWIRYGSPNHICVRVRKLNPGLGGIWKASWIELKNRLSQAKKTNLK